jgi:hypothetical protein
MRMFLTRAVERIETHILFSVTFFPKITPFVRYCPKTWCSQRRHKLRYNMAYTSCMLHKQSYMHARAGTRPSARAHARTHTKIYTNYCFSTATMIENAPHCYVLRTLPVLCLFASDIKTQMLCASLTYWNLFKQRLLWWIPHTLISLIVL